ncbi:MAG TPA: preprotein translocase subunit SecA [Actinomycetota bacterium]|nr:preprotein translocase subunit SecA [Actinomycetota bacterium]
MGSPLQKLLRAGEGRRLKRATQLALRTNDFEADAKARSDAELRAFTDVLRARHADGEDLDSLLPEAFATVREAAFRTLGQRHYDVQLIGGAALHMGLIAEMKTGEGKTLVATLPAYLNALTGKGVHIVTVNDYLARQQGAEWMGRVYRFLGLEVGLIQAQMRPDQRRPAYAADITYGTNNEFGFDYLRDNMAWTSEDRVQRKHHFAIVDEVDSILIDEARTPLIISGPAEESAKWYRTFARIVPRLKPETHYDVDEKKRTVAITEAGVHEVENILGIENLYDQISSPLVHYLQNALRAKELYKRDVDYIVTGGEVKIVDEFTGRVLEGRRYSEGMHQAIEAKENVRIKEENVTLATITIQNYFRMYDKLSGMTGTAVTEAAEFEHIYKMGVVPIPPNRPVVREDHADVVYKTEEAKFEALVEDLLERYEKGQPCLVGTVSIEKSERLSRMLEKRGVTHHVLNAKQHEREAYVIAQAGRKSSVTVATNMAGRGVDIILGGNPEYHIRQDLIANGLVPDTEDFEREMRRGIEAQRETWEKEHQEVVELGGLYVLGTERHESRRIDNQLRGRAGRQGDPGESRFYLSLEDDLMRLFATGMVTRLMDRLNIPDDTPIEAKMVSKAIERAQRQREQQNFEIRKNVLKYDDVINKQREVIYERRNHLLDGEDLSETAEQWVGDVVQATIDEFVNPDLPPEEWDLPALLTAMRTVYPTAIDPGEFDIETLTAEELVEKFTEEALAVYDQRSEEIGEEEFRQIERRVLLSVLDNKWREHLYEMDYLQEGIGLRAIGQRDPLVEYQREGYDMFLGMQHGIKQEFVQYMFHVQVVREQPAEQAQAQQQSRLRMIKESAGGQDQAPVVETARSDKVGRNGPCPCGSGRKYKKCHGLNS